MCDTDPCSIGLALVERLVFATNDDVKLIYMLHNWNTLYIVKCVNITDSNTLKLYILPTPYSEISHIFKAIYSCKSECIVKASKKTVNANCMIKPCRFL